MNLEALLAHGESLHQELGREYYLTGSGQKSEPDFHTIYQRHSVLQDAAALDTLRVSGSSELFEWIVDVRIGRLVAPYEERRLKWEQDAVLEVDGQAVPYLRAHIDLANTPDRLFRCALDAARAHAGAAALNEVRRERFQTEHAAIAALGLGDYVQALSTLSGIDLEALAEASREFLTSTDDMYRDSLRRLARQRLGLRLDDLERADGPWLFRAERYDAAFPGDRLVETAVTQMAEMGLDATQEGRVRFDTEDRDGKQARAFCVPVRVPEELYLVIRPHGGHADYRAFWHELGHAMHFASTAPDLPFAARWLGDNSVTEGFAMLWDHLTFDPGWLTRYGGLSTTQTRDLRFQVAVSELFLGRRYAAKLNYELELHRSDLTGLEIEYAERLSDATCFRYLKDDCLLDIDPGFYAARYLRAWQLEAALYATLVDRYDEDWYRDPHAGEFVYELMSRGQADPADRLALDATGVALQFGRVAERVAPALE